MIDVEEIDVSFEIMNHDTHPLQQHHFKKSLRRPSQKWRENPKLAKVNISSREQEEEGSMTTNAVSGIYPSSGIPD